MSSGFWTDGLTKERIWNIDENERSISLFEMKSRLVFFFALCPG